MNVAQKHNKILLLFLLPAAIYIVLFKLIPIAGMIIAFFDYSILGMGEFVGLEYFKQLFSSSAFPTVLKNTIILSTMKMVFVMPIPIILSLIYNQLRFKGYVKFVQTTSYLPHLLSWVIIAGIFTSIFGLDGVFNQIREMLGYEQFDYMTSKDHIRWILVMSEMWRSAGWDTILYMAAIMKIDSALYEAAVIDGASAFTQMRKITLPLLVPTIVVIFILNLGFFMSISMDQITNFANDSVMSVIDVIDSYVYRIGIQNGQYSLATAASIVKGLIGAVLITSSHLIVKRITGRGIW